MIKSYAHVSNQFTLCTDIADRPAIAWLAGLSPSTCALVIVRRAAAQTRDRARTESQARRANERLIALQREADALARQQRSLLVDLRRLEVERDLKTEQLKQIEADAQKVARELGNTGNQIDALEEETAASRPILEARMVELYKLGSAGYVRLLFNVSDLKEFGRAYRMVAAVAAIDRHRADEHKQNLVRLRAAHGSLEQRRAEMAKLQQAAAARAHRPPSAPRARARSSSPTSIAAAI